MKTLYYIPYKRDLQPSEISLLSFLIDRTDNIAITAHDLKVVARCGCGECPTVLLGQSFDDGPITSSGSKTIIEAEGRAENGTLVGIALLAYEGIPTELEAWSIDGGVLESFPPIDKIQIS